MTKVIKSLSQSIFHRLGHHSSIWKIEYLSIFTLWLFTISSLIGISLGHVDWFITKTPLNLMLGFLLVLINLPFEKKYSKLFFMGAFIFGMLLEIAGVIRGDIFGAYYYGDNLGFKVWGVPLMIGIYWAVLTVVTSQVARKLFNNTILIAIAGASMMVGLDFFMEQMAHRFDFWHFTGDIAPLQNYVTWFLAAFVLQLGAVKAFHKGGGRFAGHLYLNQLVFFVVAYLLIQL